MTAETAQKVIRQERVKQRQDRRNVAGKPQVPEYSQRRNEHQREGQEAKTVVDDRRVRTEERQEFQHTEMEIVRHRKIMHIGSTRDADAVLVQIPAVLDDALDT